MSRTVKLSWYFETPPERVWKCLTDPDLLASWLMPNDFKPVEGHRFTFRTTPRLKFGFDGIVHCTVMEIIPVRKLVYSWKGGPGDGTFNLITIVTWTLEKINDGTQVNVEHTGFIGIRNFIPFLIMRKGWKSHIAQRFKTVIENKSYATT